MPRIEMGDYEKIELEHAFEHIRTAYTRRVQIAIIILAAVSTCLSIGIALNATIFLIIAGIVSLLHLPLEAGENKMVAASYVIALRYHLKYGTEGVDYSRLYFSSIMRKEGVASSLIHVLEKAAKNSNAFSAGRTLEKYFRNPFHGPIGTSTYFIVLGVILLSLSWYLYQYQAWSLIS